MCINYKKFVNLVLNILFMDYAHSLGWYWELPVIPGLIINKKYHALYVGYHWSPIPFKEHDFFLVWFFSNICLIAGWSWILACFYSLFIVRDLSMAGVMIRGTSMQINFTFFYFIVLGELANFLTLHTSIDYFFFILFDNWVAKVTAFYAWVESITLARSCVLESWMHHIKRNKIFGTMLIRNLRARNRSQREAVAYLTVVPLIYIAFYISIINIGEVWYVTDIYAQWFLYFGNWRLPYWNPKNYHGYQGNNHFEMQAFMSDHYPWWYIPGSKKGSAMVNNPYARFASVDTVVSWRKMSFGK